MKKSVASVINSVVIDSIMDPNMVYDYFEVIITPEIIGEKCSFEDGDNLRFEYNGQAGSDDITVLDYISVFFDGKTVEEWEKFVEAFCENGTLPHIESNMIYASGAYSELARRTGNEKWESISKKLFEAGDGLEVVKSKISHLQWELSR